MFTPSNRLVPRSAAREQGINVGKVCHFQQENKTTFRDEKMELQYFLSEKMIDETSELFDSLLSEETSEE